MSGQDSHGVIWDVDGTLVDTAELHFRAWQTLANDLGKAFTRADFTVTFGRRNPEIVASMFGEHFTEQEAAELGGRKEQLYRSAAQAGVKLLPGVGELLEALHAAGYRQAIGSSTPRANLDLILRLTGTARYFQALVTMEDTHRGKPDPEVFLLAAARLSVAPSHAVVIEDAPAGVQAARAAAMKCIAVRYTGLHSAETLRQSGADLVVESLAETSVQTVGCLLGCV